MNKFRTKLLAVGASVSAVVALAFLGVAAGPANHASAVAPTNKIVVIFMENHGLTDITGDTTDWPYLNSLWTDPNSEQFTNYYSVDHPSFPNYSALFAGSEVSTSDAVTAGQFSNTTVLDQLTTAGVSWDAYEGDIPATCSNSTYYDNTTAVPSGPYKIGHGPIPFSGVYNSGNCTDVLPLTSLNPASLPSFSFIAPGLCDDGHGVPSTDTHGYGKCVTSSDSLEQRSDSWLAGTVPALVAGGADVFITFDEGNGNANQVMAIMTGPNVTGGSNTTFSNHYSLLSGIEDAFGLTQVTSQPNYTNAVVFPGATAHTPPASNCPADPGGVTETNPNPSVEFATQGWTGTFNSNSSVVRVAPTGGSTDGNYAMQATNTSGATAATGINNANPLWINLSSTSGKVYTASAEYQGANGLTAKLKLAEINSAGTTVQSTTSTLNLTDSNWHQLTESLTATNSNDTIKPSIYINNLPASGTFNADCFALYHN